MKKNKKRKSSISKKEIKVVLSIVVLLFLIFLIVYVRNYRNFAEVKLNTNKKDIFTISDLKINDLKYSSSEDKVIESFGKPKKIVNYSENGFAYKRFEYEDLSLTLREYYDDYILVGVETTSTKYKISRGLRVGSNISRVMNKYKVDNKTGSYLYGNYSYEEMSEKTDNVYMGIRTKLKVSYYNKDARVEGDTFPVDAIQKIEYEYKNGIVYKVSWSYDYE